MMKMYHMMDIHLLKSLEHSLFSLTFKSTAYNRYLDNGSY